MPFDAEEEELWEFFADCGAIDNVRLVRDKKTNIGKGIGYVQFTVSWDNGGMMMIVVLISFYSVEQQSILH